MPGKNHQVYENAVVSFQKIYDATNIYVNRLMQ